MKTKQNIIMIIALLALFSSTVMAAPVGTAFTYQGRLADGGTAANGNYDLAFTLYADASGGTSVAGPLTNSAVAVSNGLFTVALDFGEGVFTGDARWLEIAVRTNGGGTFTSLSPRQELTPTPAALYATSAGTSASASSVASNAVTASAIAAGQVVKSLNGLADSVTLAAGANVTLSTNGNTLNIAATGGGASNAWSLTGNTGTTPGTHFLGTTDNQSLELRVNNQQIVSYWPDATSPNIQAGYPGNALASGLHGVTLSGGGAVGEINSVYAGAHYSTIGGGKKNVIWSATGNPSDSSTIAGGSGNVVGFGANVATIGGGTGNQVLDGSDYSTISGGALNVISNSAWSSAIAGGRENFIAYSATYAFVGGGFRNLASANMAAIAGGQSNSVAGSQGSIGGGFNNRASGGWATVAGGANNSASANYSAIGGGDFNSAGGIGATVVGGGYDGATIGGNSASGDAATVGGGLGNSAAYDWDVVAGGRQNSAQGGYSTISGGQNNAIAATGTGANIGGGSANAAAASHATIGGGQDNNISAFANHGTVAGGRENALADALNATIAGGRGNSIAASANSSTIGGGEFNSIQSGSEYNAVGGGFSNMVAGANYAIIPGGQQAKARLYGQFAHASGAFSTPGDAQASTYVLRRTTSDGATADLGLNGTGSSFLTIPVGATWTFDILIVARGSANSAGWHVRGVIENDNGTTAFVGSPVTTPLGNDTTWTVTVEAESSNDALRIKVNGTAGTTVRWVAGVRTVEVNL